MHIMCSCRYSGNLTPNDLRLTSQMTSNNFDIIISGTTIKYAFVWYVYHVHLTMLGYFDPKWPLFDLSNDLNIIIYLWNMVWNTYKISIILICPSWMFDPKWPLFDDVFDLQCPKMSYRRNVGVILISAFVATVDSTHLKFVQQADLKTQIEDLEYRNDTKMDLTNHDTQKQVNEV